MDGTLGTHNGDNSAISIVLLILAGIFHKIADASFEDIYIWTFRALSLFSLILVIAMNFEKGIKALKKMLGF